MRTAVLMVALTLAAALVAGCISDEPGDEGPWVDDEETAVNQWVLDANGTPAQAVGFAEDLPAFGISKVSDRISGEPTVGVTREGAVFYPAMDFDVDVGGVTSLPNTDFMRSTDGGETWETKNPHINGVETHPETGDPYVYVDPTTGRVYAMDMSPFVTCNRVSWSDDEGETWTTREGACVPGVNDHPTIFAGPATAWTNTAVYPNHLYICTNQITDSICYQSPDGGITWTPSGITHLGVNPLGDSVLDKFCGGLHGHGHASWADGTIYLGREWCGDATVAVSHDGGVTFEVVEIAEGETYRPSEHDISIGTDRSGTAYALWIGDQARRVFLSTSDDQGASWSEPVDVTAPNVTYARFPSLVAGDDGRIAFLYVGTENPHGGDVDEMKGECTDANDPGCFVHPDAYNNATWNGYIGMSMNADTHDPVFVTTYANPADEPLKRGGCSDRCFGDEGGMYDFLDIDIDPMTGQVWAALVDVCSGDCDGPGKGKFDVTEKAVGVVAKLTTGRTLLENPIEPR